MDDVVNQFAKELADAIAAAVAENPEVEACRARAREAGFDMRVTLEAVVGFVNVDGANRASARCGSKGGIVGQAQIVAQPHKGFGYGKAPDGSIPIRAGPGSGSDHSINSANCWSFSSSSSWMTCFFML